MKFAINQQGRIVYAQDISLDDSYQSAALTYLLCMNPCQKRALRVRLPDDDTAAFLPSFVRAQLLFAGRHADKPGTVCSDAASQALLQSALYYLQDRFWYKVHNDCNALLHGNPYPAAADDT